jgi:hypothetical protein
MFSRSVSIEIDCDAPAYPIVRACEKLGFRSPLDVRWCRVPHAEQPARWIELLCRRPWQLLLRGSQPRRDTCSCGAPFPPFEECAFIGFGRRSHYLIGQCRSCLTIFWDEVEAGAGHNAG